MKKIFIYLIASAFIFTSCQEDESLERKGKPTVSVEGAKSITITEGEEATYNLKLSYPVNEDVHLRLEVIDGEDKNDVTTPGGEVIDFAGFGVYYGGTGYVATIPAYTTDLELKISAVQDLFPEPTETLKFRITPLTTANGFAEEEIELVINNYVQPNNDLIIRAVWDGTSYQDDNEDVTAGCSIDFDLEIFGPANFDSYYDCPEEIIMPETAADGAYAIVPSLWSLTGATTAEPTDLPVKLIVAKQGLWYNEIDLSGLWNSTDGGFVQGNAGYQALGAIVVKTGTTFELLDANGDSLGSGRMASFPTGRSLSLK